MEFKIASTAAEREAAYRLAHNRYVQANLATENSYALRVTPYHLLDTTTVFVGKVAGEVAITVTLVEDGVLGLPMEAMYADEIARRRRMGQQLAELTCLADRRQDIRRFVDGLLSLTRLLAQFARHRGVDELMAAVHPRHSRFYARYVGFEKLAGLARCPYAKNNPSVGLYLSFALCDEDRPQCYDSIFGNPVPRAMLQREEMTPRERQFLSSVCDRTGGDCSRLTA